MKKLMLVFMVFGSLGYAAPMTCDKFAKMSPSDAESILVKWEQSLDLSFMEKKDLKKEKSIIMKTNKKARHIDKCVKFRALYFSNKEKFEVVRPLKTITAYRLTVSEKKLFSSIAQEMQKRMHSLSSASVTNVNSCKYPLLFLSGEHTSKGLLIYELRMVKNRVKTFASYLDLKNNVPDFKCGNMKAKQTYLNYLNVEKGLNLHDSLENDVYRFPQQNEISSDFLKNYEVLSSFQARYFKSGKKIQISQGKQVQIRKMTNDEVFFIMDGIKYRATKTIFLNNTQGTTL